MKKLMAALFALTLCLQAYAAPDEITDCDREAGHPSDPDRVGDGKRSNEVVTHLAIPACRAAVAAEPNNPRFQYQLGRAIVYWGGANNADYSEGLEYVQRAADADYTQALFVLGLMHIRHGEACEAEPYYKRAAERGLKSAQLPYVNFVTSGENTACTVSASDAEMTSYLDGAAKQVSGYYENMLLVNLRRQLSARQTG